MHEARLCLSLLRLAEEAARREGARRIVALTLEVGSLSGVQGAALEAVFPACARGTPAEGARLVITAVTGRELVLRELEVC